MLDERSRAGGVGTEPPEGQLHCGGVGKSLLWVEGEGATEQCVELVWDLCTALLRRASRGMARGLEQLDLAIALHIALASKQLEQQEPDSVDVGPLIDLTAADLFWGEVSEGALQLPCLGSRQPAARLGHSEVTELHVSSSTDQDVPWREIAVDDLEGLPLGVSGVVHVGEGTSHLGHDEGRGVRWKRAARVEQDREVATVDPLHGEVGRVIDLAIIEDLHEPGVAQGGAQPRLIGKHLTELGLPGELREHALERHELGEPSWTTAPSEKDLRHTANGDPFHQLVWSELLHDHSRLKNSSQRAKGRGSERAHIILITSGHTWAFERLAAEWGLPPNQDSMGITGAWSGTTTCTRYGIAAGLLGFILGLGPTSYTLDARRKMNASMKLALVLLTLVTAGFAGIYALLYSDGGLTLMLVVGGITLIVLLVSALVWLTVGSPWQSQGMFPSGSPRRAAELLEQARSTQKSGDDAESHYRKAIEEARRALGPNSPELLPYIYGQLDCVNSRPGFAQEAVELASDGLRIVEQSALSPENHVLALDRAAWAFSNWGRYRTAASLRGQLVTMLEQHDTEPPVVAIQLASLAEAQEGHGQSELALETVERALSLGLSEPLLEVMAHNTRATSLIDLGRYHDAIEGFQRTLHILETKDIEDADALRSLVAANLSVTYRYLGDLEEAAELGARARTLAGHVLHDDHPLWATLDFNDGERLKMIGDLEGALEAHTGALEHRQRTLFDEHKSLACSMVALAEVKLELGSADEATESYQSLCLRMRRWKVCRGISACSAARSTTPAVSLSLVSR